MANEKRFKIAKGVPADIFPSVLDEDRKLYLDEVIELLNYFYEKNEWLQEGKDYWKSKFDEGTETFESNLVEENERLRKQVENLQDALAKICATLILDGFEIEFDGKNLSELIDDE